MPDQGALIRQLQGRVAALPSRTVRGEVAADGTVVRGAGFSVAKTGTGAYTVSFSEAFPLTPVVVVGAGPVAGANDAKLASSPAPSASGFGVTTFTSTTGAAADLAFSFVAEAV